MTDPLQEIFETPAIRLLKACTEKKYTMRQLLQRNKQSHDKTYDVIKQLMNASFIESESQKKGRGRPSKIIVLTSLGEAYLRSFSQNQLKCVPITDKNIKKIMHLADLTQHLVESGINPYDRFTEMNKIALAIRGSQ